MTIESLEGKVQPSVGTQEHWRQFTRFQGSDLHGAIVVGVQSYLDREQIDSSIAGSEVLRQIGLNSPRLFEQYAQDDTGGLFGMTLWNLLAESSARWVFYPKKADPLDDISGTVYFRPRVGTAQRSPK